MESEINAEVIPVIAARESRRALAPDPLPSSLVERILEAGRWAPSSSNRQPWHFVVVQGDARLQLQASLNTGNEWAKVAPLLLAVVSREEDGTLIGERRYFLFDCGLAVENMLLQATYDGVVCHPMAGFDADIARKALGIPDGMLVIVLVAFGYPGRFEDLDARTQQKELLPRTRKPLTEIVHWDRWES